MGGRRSGKRRNLCAKELTADYRSLDVQLLKRRGQIYLAGGSCDPSRRSKFAHISAELDGPIGELDGPTGSAGGEVFIRVYPNHLYVTDGPNRTVIALERTQCNFGGTRVWFQCPNARCGRRAAVLYLAGEIKCRKCAQLRYESQYDSRFKRNLRKCRLIRWQLGGSANLLDPFPQKPRGMRWARYESLRNRAARAETVCFSVGS
jgi:hypothetical protein